MKYKVSLLVVSALLVLENYQNTTYSVDNLMLYNLMHECWEENLFPKKYPTFLGRCSWER